MKKVYNKVNKSAKVGEECKCPTCGKTFIKKSYQQVFCCNDCKVAFWNTKPDRHKKGYYHKYNAEHPERLERGYTKGYVNGNVSEGRINISRERSLAEKFWNPTLSDLLEQKEQEWHDDDWCEEPE